MKKFWLPAVLLTAVSALFVLWSATSCTTVTPDEDEDNEGEKEEEVGGRALEAFVMPVGGLPSVVHGYRLGDTVKIGAGDHNFVVGDETQDGLWEVSDKAGRVRLALQADGTLEAITWAAAGDADEFERLYKETIKNEGAIAEKQSKQEYWDEVAKRISELKLSASDQVDIRAKINSIYDEVGAKYDDMTKYGPDWFEMSDGPVVMRVRCDFAADCFFVTIRNKDLSKLRKEKEKQNPIQRGSSLSVNQSGEGISIDFKPPEHREPSFIMGR